MNFRILRSFGWLFFLLLLAYVCSFFGQMAISYYFGTSSSLDSYYTVFAAASLLLFYVNPIKDSLIKVIYDADKGNEMICSQLFSSSIILQLCLVSLFSSVFLIKEMAVFLAIDIELGNNSLLLIGFLPYFFLFALAETANGILLSLNKVFYQAFARLFSSIVALISIFFFAKSYGIFSLVLSLQLSQFILAAISYIGLYNNGIKFIFCSPILVLKHKVFMSMLISLLVSYLMAQVYVIVERLTMINMQTGLVASFQYSVILVNVGISIVIQPVLNFVWPKLMVQNSSGDTKKLTSSLELTSLFLFIILVFGCAFVYFNSFDLVKLIYSRGEFNDTSVRLTSIALKATIFTAIPVGLYGLFSRILITIGKSQSLAIAASSIAIIGIIVILTSYWLGNRDLIMLHWLVGNFVGAFIAFMAVRKEHKDIFLKKQYLFFLIKCCLAIGIGISVSSYSVFFYSFQSELLMVIFKFIIYVLVVGIILILTGLSITFKHFFHEA